VEPTKADNAASEFDEVNDSRDDDETQP
jgi:hypothetical protein